MFKLNADVFDLFDKQWALLTAGNKDSFNTMTVSWGALGTIWGKPAATVYVRFSRYTHEFIEKENYFTLSFFPEEQRGALKTLGVRSGRSMDKMHGSGLTPDFLLQSVAFKEASLVLVCKKLFQTPLPVDHIPLELVNRFYSADGNNAPHDMFIGEVVDVISRS